LNPNFDYPVIVQTYDLLTDREVNTILESAGIDPSEYREFYGKEGSGRS
jgi:hypothetical protein